MHLNVHDFGGRELGNFSRLKEVFDGVSRWGDTMADFKRTIDILKADALKCIKRSQTFPENQFWRRNVVKTVFALFEGQIFLMKRIAVDRYANIQIAFSDAELAMLREDKYTLTDKGDAKATSNNFQRFVPNYQFAFKAFAKAHDTSFTCQPSGVVNLNKLEAVRNRLTHPKTHFDLTVKDDEMQLAGDVFTLHFKETTELLKLCNERELNRELKVKHVEYEFPPDLQATLPVLMLARDGTVFEFETKRQARLYGKANGWKETARDYTLQSFTDVLEALSGL